MDIIRGQSSQKLPYPSTHQRFIPCSHSSDGGNENILISCTSEDTGERGLDLRFLTPGHRSYEVGSSNAVCLIAVHIGIKLLFRTPYPFAWAYPMYLKALQTLPDLRCNLFRVIVKQPHRSGNLEMVCRIPFSTKLFGVEWSGFRVIIRQQTLQQSFVRIRSRPRCTNRLCNGRVARRAIDDDTARRLIPHRLISSPYDLADDYKTDIPDFHRVRVDRICIQPA